MDNKWLFDTMERERWIQAAMGKVLNIPIQQPFRIDGQKFRLLNYIELFGIDSPMFHLIRDNQVLFKLLSDEFIKNVENIDEVDYRKFVNFYRKRMILVLSVKIINICRTKFRKEFDDDLLEIIKEVRDGIIHEVLNGDGSVVLDNIICTVLDHHN